MRSILTPKENVDLYHYERNFLSKGKSLVCGVDEAGRGAVAGPVVVASVIFPQETNISKINDSKKLSKTAREKLFIEIKDKALSYAIKFGTVELIERENILQTTLVFMKRAVESLKMTPELALIDGNIVPELQCESQPIIKGDSLSFSVAAASILAKVTRDRYMKEIAKVYPEYGFEIHKGYGTKLHLEALKKYGLCKIHRRKFCTTFLKNK